MSQLLQDVKYAARRLLRTPVFSLFALAILTIGIGLNAAVFGLVDAMLLRPAPFADPATLVHVYQDSDSGVPAAAAYPAYRDIAAMTDVFADVAASTPFTASWETPDGPQEVAADFATASLFPTLGLRTQLGRWFDAEHDRVGAEMVAVVTDKAWRARFGGDPGVLGRTIRLNNQPVTIVGIGPRDFNGEASVVATELWLSISSVGIGGPFRVANLDRREDHWWGVKARLAPGVGIEQARAALRNLAARLGEQFPALDRGRDITLLPSDRVRLHPQFDSILLGAGLGLFVVAGAVLLLACSNLANLLLVRGLARAPELAVREALGGSRAQIARPLLIEALLLSLTGGTLGLFAAVWAQQLWSRVPMPLYGGAMDVRVDYRIVVFSVLAALGTGLLFGFLPSRRSSKTGVAAVLRDASRMQSAGRGAAFLRGSLVVAQVALSVVLVVATALLGRSLVNVTRVDPGVDTERIAVVATNLPLGGVSAEEAPAVTEQILERVAALPGVARAALTTRLPLSGGQSTTTVIDGYEPEAGTGAVELQAAAVSRDYFAAMGIPLLQGRTFAATDSRQAPRVVVVSEAAARLYWGGDIAGARVRPQGGDEWREVIGVVGDVKVADLGESPTPLMYFSTDQQPQGVFSVVARTAGDPAALLGVLPGALREARPSLPVTRVLVFETHVANALATARTSTLLLGTFAALALVLAGLGIYAAVSFAVEQRTHEIGIRVALGATGSRLLRMVVGQSLVVAGVGVVVGLGLAVLAALGLRGLLFGIPTFDAVSFAAAAGALVAAAALAAFFPARRAVGANPADVLRSQ